MVATVIVMAVLCPLLKQAKAKNTVIVIVPISSVGSLRNKGVRVWLSNS